MTAADTWPRPVAPYAFHGVFGEITQALAPQTEADPHAILFQLLTMFGSTMGRTAHFHVERDSHYMTLFTAIVGASAKGRKGVSRRHAQAIFAEVDEGWVRDGITSGLSSGEGLLWAIRDPIERQQPVKQGGRVVDYQTVVEDPGVTDKRLLVVEEELASMLRVMTREGNTLSAIVRQLWDGHDHVRTLTKSSPARATRPHVQIIGHITRDELRRELTATDSANGFANRFLFIAARRARMLPDGGAVVDLAPYLDDIRTAVLHAKQTGTMYRDDAAGQLWHRVYSRLSAARPGLLGAVTGRAEAQTMRLACLLALSDCSSVVQVPHLRAALELWRYAGDSAKYIFSNTVGDRTADEILAALRAVSPASLTRKAILHDVLGRNKPAAEITRALQLLAEHGLAKHEEDRSGVGRPAERWFSCNPPSYDQYDLNDLIGAPDHLEQRKVVKVVAASPRTETPSTVPGFTFDGRPT